MLCVGSAVKAAGKLEEEVCRWGADGMQKMERWKNGEGKLKIGAGESP